MFVLSGVVLFIFQSSLHPFITVKLRTSIDCPVNSTPSLRVHIHNTCNFHLYLNPTILGFVNKGFRTCHCIFEVKCFYVCFLSVNLVRLNRKLFDCHTFLKNCRLKITDVNRNYRTNICPEIE